MVELIRELHESVLSEKGIGPLIGSDETCFKKSPVTLGFFLWMQRVCFFCHDNRSTHSYNRAVQTLMGSGMDTGDPGWHDAMYRWWQPMME